MNRLSFREKYIVITGAAVVFVFLVVQFVFLPLTEQKNELERILTIEQDGIQQMITLQDQYFRHATDMNKEQQHMTARSPQFTLFSFLDSQAEAAGVKENIDYIRPFSQTMDNGPFRISKVRLKLKNMYLNDFMEFLRRVETLDNGVHVVSISLAKTGEKNNLLEAVMETQTLMPGESQ
jgi:hypothetical protein